VALRASASRASAFARTPEPAKDGPEEARMFTGIV